MSILEHWKDQFLAADLDGIEQCCAEPSSEQQQAGRKRRRQRASSIDLVLSMQQQEEGKSLGDCMYETEFFKRLFREIQKVDAFATAQYQEYQKRLDQLLSSSNTIPFHFYNSTSRRMHTGVQQNHPHVIPVAHIQQQVPNNSGYYTEMSPIDPAAHASLQIRKAYNLHRELCALEYFCFHNLLVVSMLLHQHDCTTGRFIQPTFMSRFVTNKQWHNLIFPAFDCCFNEDNEDDNDIPKSCSSKLVDMQRACQVEFDEAYERFIQQYQYCHTTQQEMTMAASLRGQHILSVTSSFMLGQQQQQDIMSAQSLLRLSRQYGTTVVTPSDPSMNNNTTSTSTNTTRSGPPFFSNNKGNEKDQHKHKEVHRCEQKSKT